MATNYVSKINGNKIFAERAEYTKNGVQIDTKLTDLEQKIAAVGSYQVVPLTSGENPVPDVEEPSTKVIYLTKEAGSTKTDPYTEWIYIAGTPSGTWEVIGETTVDLSGYKQTQTAVEDPSASGTGLTFISNASQDVQGVITVSKMTVQDGTTSQKGVVQLTNSYESTSTDTAATPAAVKAAYDLANTHVHGNITHDGKIGDTANLAVVTTTAGEVNTADLTTASPTVPSEGTTTEIEFIDTVSQDSKGQISASKKTVRSATTSQTGVVQLAGSIGATIDTENNKAATEKAVRDAINALDVTAVGTAGDYIQTISEADGKISATVVTMDTTPTPNSTKAITSGAVYTALNDLGGTVVYVTTSNTYTEITNYINANKVPVLNVSGEYYELVKSTGTSYVFEKIEGNVSTTYEVTSTSGWDNATTKTLEDTANKTSSIRAVSSADDTKYPTEKAVRTELDTKTNKVIAGSGVTLTNHVAVLTQDGDIADGGYGLDHYKTVQNAVSDPSADGNGLAFIATASQDAQGVITVTKKTVQDGTTSQKGVVQLQDSIGATETTDTKAATPKSVRDAINALDATVTSAGDTGVTPNFELSVTEADGVITGVTVTSDNTESKNNKVTSWSSTVTDTNFPSEKLVKDSLDTKADKVSGATNGHFAGLDANGNLTDSGKAAGDFATAAQGVKADSAIQGVIGWTDVSGTATSGELTPDANKKVTIPLATNSTYGIVTIETTSL